MKECGRLSSFSEVMKLIVTKRKKFTMSIV